MTPMNQKKKCGWLKRWLFAAELAEMERLREACAKESEDVRRLTFQLSCAESRIPVRRTAVLSAKPRHTEEEVRQILAGTRELGYVSAILSVVEAAIVTASDGTMDPPREGYTAPNGKYVPGYSAELRTHCAGGGYALAELLAQLQELTAPRQKEAKTGE